MKRINYLLALLIILISQASFASATSFSGSDSCVPAPKKLLVLTESELENLGIVYDSSGFVYVQILGARSWHTQVAYNRSTHYVSYRMQVQGYNRKKAIKVELIGIASCQGELVYSTKTDDRYQEIDPTKEEECVAIKVPFGSAQDSYAVVWFPITNDLLDLLPEEATLALKKSKRAYDVPLDEFEAAARKYFIKSKQVKSSEEKEPYKFEGSVDSIFIGENIVDGSEHLKELGISFKSDWFQFNQNGINFMYTEKGFQKTGGSINSYEQSISYDLKKMLPLYITVEGKMTDAFGPSAMGLGMDGGRLGYAYGQFWQKERQRMIGLSYKLKNGKRLIFWYAYAPVIKGLLSPSERARVEGFIKFGFKLSETNVSPRIYSLDQLKLESSTQNSAYALWTLRPEQMKLLGLTFDSLGQVLFPFKSPGGSPIWYFINKYEVGLSDKTETIPGMDIHAGFLYDNLVCITDGRGTGPRMNNAGTGEGLNWDNLIPVRISTGKTISLYEQGAFYWTEDVIFWFRTDSEVLKRFGEINGYSYFPVAEAKLVDFSKVNLVLKRNVQQDAFSPIYSLKLNWRSKEKLNCTLVIYNMEGLPIYTANVGSKGKNTLKLPVELFNTGFYTAVVTSEAGDEIQFPIMMPYEVWR